MRRSAMVPRDLRGQLLRVVLVPRGSLQLGAPGPEGGFAPLPWVLGNRESSIFNGLSFSSLSTSSSQTLFPDLISDPRWLLKPPNGVEGGSCMPTAAVTVPHLLLEVL